MMFAVVGVISLLATIVFFGLRLSTDPKRREYFYGFLVVGAITLVATVAVFRLDGDAKTATSTLVAAALSTIGWIYTIVYLRNSSESQEVKEQKSQRKKFYDDSLAANTNLIASVAQLRDAISADAELYKQVTAANGVIGSGLDAVVHSLNQGASSLVASENDKLEISGRYEKAKLTLRLIEAHMLNPEIRAWREVIRQEYPIAADMGREEARRIWNSMRDKADSKDMRLGVALQSTLNFYELIALMDACSLLDRRLLRTYFGTILPSAHTKLKTFIFEAQGAGRGGKNEAYCYLEALVANWQEYSTYRPQTAGATEERAVGRMRPDQNT